MMLELLQKYIRINTSFPTYHYHQAIELFERHALQDDLLTTRIELSSGLPALIITLPGSDESLPALALNHHMDVVPARREDGWICDPFTARIMNDKAIIGRGTQDMKGVGVVHYAALREFNMRHGTPKRTIHLIMVPDEEHGGFAGTACFLKHPLFESLQIGFVLDEGMPSGDDTMLYIKISERTPLQVRITAYGHTAHGACSIAHNPIHELIQVLHTLTLHHRKQQELCAATSPGLICSYNITALASGTLETHNLIPAQASSTVDIRISPTVELHNILKELDLLCAAHNKVRYEVLAQGITDQLIVEPSSRFYQSIVAAAHLHGLSSKPHHFEAASDARFYAQQGIPALGFTPFTTPANLHGVNESISVHDLERGKNIMFSILQQFCGE